MSIFPRERITDALQDSANRGIALVVAPAGFGKTEAVVDAFGKSAHWIETPENPGVEVLAREIVSAAVPRYLRAASPLLSRAPTEEHRKHLTDWVAARLRSVEQPVIFEDFQRACADPDALRFIRDVVEATVPQVRWVFVSRETPELPIGTWLARDYMTLPLSTDDLAFDVDEARGIAGVMDVEIDDGDLATLVEDVSGWPMAVRLSLGSWERRRDLPPLRIRTRGVLFDFIQHEIWAQLAETERQFFIAAANLSELRPRILVAAGFSDARLSLEQLHRRWPLLSKLGNGSFRLHELFRDFILERCQGDAETRTEIIKGLARAIERFGSFEEAVGMYLTAEQYEGAIGLLERHAIDRIDNGHRAEIAALIARLPRKYWNHPVVVGIRGYALALDGSFDLARREIQTALAGTIDAGLRGELALQAGTAAFNAGNPAEAVVLLRDVMGDERFVDSVHTRAAATLSIAHAMMGDEASARDTVGFCSSGLDTGTVEMRALIRHRLAYAHLLLGEYALAEHYASESAQLALSIGLDSLGARAYSVLQTVASVTYAESAITRRYAEACFRCAESSGDRALQIFATQALLGLAADCGDDDLYRVSIRRFNEFQVTPNARDRFMVAFSAMLYEVGGGKTQRAISILEAYDLRSASKAEGAAVQALLGLLYASLNPERAEALVRRPVIVSAEPDSPSRRNLAFAQAYHALTHWLLGRGREARRMRTPDTSGMFPRDAAVVTTIVTICATSRGSITPRRLDQLTEPLIALELDGHARFLRTLLSPAAVQTLTRTELEVLRALRSGGTTNEVADRLGKSSHTVLSHLKSACAKLGCSGRAAAVNYAVDMGWID